MTEATAPRLLPLSADGWAHGDWELLRGHLNRADTYLSGRADAPALPGILGLFGHHPRLAGGWLGFNGLLLDDPLLDPRDRELLILRVAWRTRCRYEWVQHVPIGHKAGLDEREVAAVTVGPTDPLWPERDQVLLEAADQMIDAHGVREPTWQSLTTHFTEAQLLELLFVVGGYLCLALVLNGVGLEPDADSDDGPIPFPTKG